MSHLAESGKTIFKVTEKMANKMLELTDVKALHDFETKRVSSFEGYAHEATDQYYPQKTIKANITGSEVLVGVECHLRSKVMSSEYGRPEITRMKIKEISDYFSGIIKITKAELKPGKVDRVKKDLSDTTPVSEPDGHI